MEFPAAQGRVPCHFPRMPASSSTTARGGQRAFGTNLLIAAGIGYQDRGAWLFDDGLVGFHTNHEGAVRRLMNGEQEAIGAAAAFILGASSGIIRLRWLCVVRAAMRWSLGMTRGFFGRGTRPNWKMERGMETGEFSRKQEVRNLSNPPVSCHFRGPGLVGAPRCTVLSRQFNNRIEEEAHRRRAGEW